MASDNVEHYCVCITPLQQVANDKAALLNEMRWDSADVIRVKFLEGDETLQQRVRGVS